MKADNNFGFLRLLFASLVVIGHSPELIDGNRSRELLTVVFGTLTLGEVAVDGFFLISGYLIAKSYLQTRSPMGFFLKRILRIYPGYIVACLFCLLIVGPLAGGALNAFSAAEWLKQFVRILRFGIPDLPGAFEGLPYTSLNGSLWTIRYEFGCYIALMIAGMAGILKSRQLFLTMTVALAVTAAILHMFQPFQHAAYILFHSIRFLAIFCIGAIFFLYRDRIVYSGKMALGAAILLIPLMLTPVAETAVAVLGGYILFWFALTVRAGFIASIGRNTDLSYGLYLYAWPVQNLTISFYRDISPVELSLFTFAVAGAIAYLSWILVEGPFLRLKALAAPPRPQIQQVR